MPDVDTGTFRGMFKYKLLGTGPNAFAMMLLWSVLAILSVWALAVVVFQEGFTRAGYDQSHVELQYRLWSEPVEIPWQEIKEIKFIKRTSRSYRMNWRIRITEIGGDVYESVICSKMSDPNFDLMNEAVSELQQEWILNRE